MEQLASPGTTFLTADTLRLVEGYVEIKPLGAMPIKGLPAPVENYELTGAGPRRSRLSAAAAQGLTRFEESVRSLVDEGVLAGARGAYRLLKATKAIHVPTTVHAILAARIDRLPTEDKDLLQTASVIGTNVPLAVLAGVAGEPADALAEGLGRLQAAEFLYETSLFPDVEYSFKHALTHEVAYGSLLQDRRRALHARAVEAIERCYPERLSEHIERLAHHALRGEVWEQAVTYLRQAGGKATERSAYREAVTCFEQALEALAHLPQETEWRERAIDLHFDAGRGLTTVGERAKSVAHARRAEALAEAVGDDRRLGRALLLLGTQAWNWGETDRGLELARRALALASGLGDVLLQASVNYTLAAIGQSTGNYRESVEAFSRLGETL